MKTLNVTGAQGTLFTTGTPTYAGQSAATLGDIQADTPAALHALLQQAQVEARTAGFSHVLGPMNRNTWYSYRAVVEDTGAPYFPMEPQTPLFYAEVFAQAEWEVIGAYSSAIDTVMALPPTTPTLPPELTAITQRSFMDTEADLSAIYTICQQAFAHNFLYTPLSEDDFKTLYRPLIQQADPRWIRLAFAPTGAPVGFVFALPFGQQLIMKTYASLLKGLGRVMGEHLLRDAKTEGFTSLVHALMYDDNLSKKNSGRYAATVFRRYALFGKRV